jgi:hypothetical protein
MTVSFDIADPEQNRFNGFGPAPFPDLRDHELDEYVMDLRRTGPEGVAKAIRAVSSEGGRVMGAYAERTATRAVRDKAPDLLVSGLVALVVAGLYDNDREALLRMAPIHDAARRSGSRPRVVIKRAARIVGNPGKKYLNLWLWRFPRSQTLAVMGYQIGSDKSGFRYVRNW